MDSDFEKVVGALIKQRCIDAPSCDGCPLEGLHGNCLDMMEKFVNVQSAKIEYDSVVAALWGRIMRGDLGDDFDSLAVEISNQVEIDVERCKEIMHNSDALILAGVFL